MDSVSTDFAADRMTAPGILALILSDDKSEGYMTAKSDREELDKALSKVRLTKDMSVEHFQVLYTNALEDYDACSSVPKFANTVHKPGLKNRSNNCFSCWVIVNSKPWWRPSLTNYAPPLNWTKPNVRALTSSGKYCIGLMLSWNTIGYEQAQFPTRTNVHGTRESTL
jgi:hypothetical protein